MTDKNDNQKPVSVDNEVHQNGDATARARRALLKGAVGALPMILTLQSGAALARSSNLISASQPGSAKDAEGRMLCMDYRYVDMVVDGDGDSGQSRVADLGSPPYANISAIPRRMYFDEPEGERIYRREICYDGGVYSFQKTSGEWAQTGYVPKGMLVSATALSSFAGSYDITEI